jgi:hypothetical protein
VLARHWHSLSSDGAYEGERRCMFMTIWNSLIIIVLCVMVGVGYWMILEWMGAEEGVHRPSAGDSDDEPRDPTPMV